MLDTAPKPIGPNYWYWSAISLETGHAETWRAPIPRDEAGRIIERGELHWEHVDLRQ